MPAKPTGVASHGDVKALADSLRNVVESYTYDAFGNLLERTFGAGSTTQSTDTLPHFLNDILYAGEQYDEVTETYYLRARNYSPAEGRFISEDKYHGDGRNLYVYVRNNPLRYVDPSGYCKKGSGDYISELWNNFYQGVTYVLFDSLANCKLFPLNVSSVSPLCYPCAFGIDTFITIVKIICNDVVDEIIEVAGDYVPSEYLEGASIAFEYRSRHYEAIAEFNEELSDFFLGSMIPTLALTGTVLKDAAPSLVTPEGAVVETSAAAIGATAVTGEAVLEAFCKGATYGNRSAADRDEKVSEKLQNKFNDKRDEGVGEGGKYSN